MTSATTIKVSSRAAAVAARAVVPVSTWQPCADVPSLTTSIAKVRMHDGNGFLTTRRPKERSSP